MDLTSQIRLVLESARQMDSEDSLARFRDEFVIDDPDLIYLDGNSLGRLPKRTAQQMRELVDDQWGQRLVRGWGEHWVDLPQRVGAKIAGLIGAQPDEVIVCDSTSVNFYKLAMAALNTQVGKTNIVTDTANFPSDLYLLQGCARQLGHSIVYAEPEEASGVLDQETALLTLSHISFKRGFIQPMAELSRIAHEKGALTLWDLSHSVGSIPIDLNGCSADLAVGCTYKYLNGGPGAPAFLYVRKDLQEKLINPIWGWFGQKDAFDFGPDYTPADGIQRFMAGTPPIISMAAVECGVDLILEAGIDRLREKSMLQTEFLDRLWEIFLEPLGFSFNSPKDAGQRGSHVSFGHREAYRIDQALIHDMNVIPDFRHPDNIRFGITPISTTFVELVEAVLRTRQVVEDRIYEKYPSERSAVT